MLPKTDPERTYWHGSYEGYEARCRRRLLHDLGVEEAAAETILRLRSQVVELQAQVRALDAELNAVRAVQYARLIRFREVYYETDWVELQE
jgi:hypothetical protein